VCQVRPRSSALAGAAIRRLPAWCRAILAGKSSARLQLLNRASFSAAVPCISRRSASATVFFAFGSFRFRNIATSHFNYLGCFTMARATSLRPEAI